MANFGSSFAESFESSYKTSSDASLELLKEKIKADQAKAEEKYKATTLRNSNIAIATEFGDQDIAKKIINVSEAVGDSSEGQKNVNEFAKFMLKEKMKTTVGKPTVKGFVVNTANAGVTPIINPETGSTEFSPGTRLLQAPMTPETVAARTAASEGAKFESPIQTEARTSKLRTEFQAVPVVKDFQIIREQVGVMDDLIKSIKVDDNTKDSNALALDQALITTFNKITDPTSVVRESEYERTPSNLSLANRFTGAFEKLKKGGAGLTKKDREALVFGAKVIADSRGSRYNKILSSYRTIAEDSGAEPDMVTIGFGEYKPFGVIGGGSSQQKSGMVTIYNKSGQSKEVSVEEARKMGVKGI